MKRLAAPLTLKNIVFLLATSFTILLLNINRILFFPTQEELDRYVFEEEPTFCGGDQLDRMIEEAKQRTTATATKNNS